jgi:hypothetical protein
MRPAGVVEDVQVLEHGEMLFEAFERLQRAGELHLAPGAAGVPFMRIHAIGEKQATIANRSLRGVLSQGFKPRQRECGSEAFEQMAAVHEMTVADSRSFTVLK